VRAHARARKQRIATCLHSNVFLLNFLSQIERAAVEGVVPLQAHQINIQTLGMGKTCSTKVMLTQAAEATMILMKTDDIIPVDSETRV
jgi:hypothetical protein